MTERLWTPWRMAYIEGADREERCVFCDLPKAGDDDASLILARSGTAYVIMNRFPYSPGHLMVVPFRHTAEYETLTETEHADMTALTARCIAALKQTSRPQGFNLGVNQGRPAGAGIADHIHLHIVPRWGGDTNFMTTVGEIRVLPEMLVETFAKLKPRLAE